MIRSQVYSADAEPSASGGTAPGSSGALAPGSQSCSAPAPGSFPALRASRESELRLHLEYAALCAEAAQEVARIKLASDPQAEFYRPEREAQVLRMVKERNQGPLSAESVARLFLRVPPPARTKRLNCVMGPSPSISAKV